MKQASWQAEGGGEAERQALTPVPKHVNFCVCGEGSPSREGGLASGNILDVNSAGL